MVTEEELQERYVQLDNESLLEIATNRSGFTELANSVALKELKKEKFQNTRLEIISLFW